MFRHFRTVFVLCLAAVLLTGVASADIEQTFDEQISLGTNTLFYSVVPSGNAYFISAVYDDRLAVLKTDDKFKTKFQKEIKGIKSAGLVATDDGGCVVLSLIDDKTANLYRLDEKCGIVWETPIYGASFGINGVAVNGGSVKIAGWVTGTDTGYIQSFSYANGAPANDELKIENKVVVSIISDGDGYVLVGGTLSEPMRTGSHAWIMKIQDGGRTVFDTTIRENCDEENAGMYRGGYGAVSYTLCKTSDGGYYVVGTQTPLGNDNQLIFGQIWGAKVDKSGKVTWQKDLYGAVPFGVAEISGQYLIAGYTLSTAYCYFATADGLVYRKVYEDESVGSYYSVAKDSDGKVILGGCLNRGNGRGACGYVKIFEDTGAASSPVPAFGVTAGLIAACALLIRRK